MTNELQQLPKAEQKVVAKVLHGMGWGSRQIEKWLGISDSSVLRAAKEPTPKELTQFESDFEEAITSAKQHGVALGVRRLLELLPKERRIDQVVKGLEYMEGKNIQPLGAQANVQINFTRGE